MFDDAELCRAVIDGLVTAGPDRWPAGVAELDEADLADLYERLCTWEEIREPRPENEPGVP